MDIQATALEGLYLLKLDRHIDARGLFQKPYNYEAFKAWGLEMDFRESYYSVSARDVLRGMHFQAPPADHAKLVYVSHGRIMDVALDIRVGSLTYGQYFARELYPEANEALYLPSGFAHGFHSLEDGTVVNYMQTSCYDSTHDGGVRWDSFGFAWVVVDPIVSVRDQKFPALSDFKSPFVKSGGANALPR